MAEDISRDMTTFPELWVVYTHACNLYVYLYLISNGCETSYESIIIEIYNVLGCESIDEDSVAVPHLDTDGDPETRQNIPIESPELCDDEDEDGYLKPIPAAAAIMTHTLYHWEMSRFIMSYLVPLIP